MCPAETPEGASVGVVKNLSYMCHLTIPSNSGPIHEYVFIEELEGVFNNEDTKLLFEDNIYKKHFNY